MPSTLVSLSMTDNYIDEVRGLDALVNLKDLDLSDNRLRKITGILKRLLACDGRLDHSVL